MTVLIGNVFAGALMPEPRKSPVRANAAEKYVVEKDTKLKANLVLPVRSPSLPVLCKFVELVRVETM